MSDEMMLLNIDKNQLSQVIINVVINAVAAMNGKGTLTFRTYRQKATHEVYLEISDTGLGIPEENLEKIFTPLFTTKVRGIGLGLAVSKKTIETHEGSIEVESEVGKGSTFTVRLPIGGGEEE